MLIKSHCGFLIQIFVLLFRKRLISFASLWNVNDVRDLQKWKSVYETEGD